jgi:excisionase family DNA binding protein
MDAADTEREFLTLAEAAIKLGVSVPTIRRRIAERHLSEGSAWRRIVRIRADEARISREAGAGHRRLLSSRLVLDG